VEQINKESNLDELSDLLAKGFESKPDDDSMEKILRGRPGWDWLNNSTEYILASLRVIYELNGKSGVKAYLDKLFKSNISGGCN